ncbi:hypothetical protein NUU61_005159 [Penicillium alfredii]|uniref:Uncharacterized protein n=1 Tax=Penicillium alfredii TaxID=1506179 RepID=A0A9W9K7B4_9EURO|nr:uncharacterized protein NUU61_005159 [Penicillium alfredii]KAJ5095803.1 hypothetical protein NUU61_005159 [Penicillium alfredii]
MAPLKDAHMACSVPAIKMMERSLKESRNQCLKLLDGHNKFGKEQLWTKKDGAGQDPETEEDKIQMKLATLVEFHKDEPAFPPTNTRLSDELVYLATKFINAKARGEHYPYDFTANGEIRTSRVPSGPAPILWAHGLPFFPIYKGYYILCGREHAPWIGWRLQERKSASAKDHPMWSVGAVVAPASAVAAKHTVDRQLFSHKAEGKDIDKIYKGKDGSRDVIASSHHWCTVLPKSAEGVASICPLWSICGYNVHCGPQSEDDKTVTIMPQEYFAKHGIEVNYAVLAKPYANNKKPRAIGARSDVDGDSKGYMESNMEFEDLGDEGTDDETPISMDFVEEEKDLGLLGLSEKEEKEKEKEVAEDGEKDNEEN